MSLPFVQEKEQTAPSNRRKIKVFTHFECYEPVGVINDYQPHRYGLEGPFLHLLVGSDGGYHLFTWLMNDTNTKRQRRPLVVVVIMAGAKEEVR